MISSDAFNDFCNAHFAEAQEYAEKAIGSIIKANGAINRRYDVENIKHLAVLSALEKAFLNYDPQKSKDKTVSPLLYTIVCNDIKTELGKEKTAIDRFDGIKRRKTKDDGSTEGCSIIPGIASFGKSGRLFEPHEYMDIFGGKKGKEQQIRKILEAYKQLHPWDQTVLYYWTFEEEDDMAYYEAGEKPQRTYVQRAIDDLHLDKSWTNAITIRCFKAKKKLAALLKGVPADYQDIYVPGSSKWENIDDMSNMRIKIYSEDKYALIVERLFKKITEK